MLGSVITYFDSIEIRIPLSLFRIPHSDFRLPTSAFRLPTSDEFFPKNFQRLTADTRVIIVKKLTAELPRGMQRQPGD